MPSAKFWKVKMALSLELGGILWWNVAYTLILTRCSQWDCQIIFGIGRGFVEVQILKKKRNWPYPLNLLVYFGKLLHTHYYWHDLEGGIAKSSPRYCKMTFNIGRGCAELKILKKWKCSNWVDCCDESLHTYWYWKDVAQEIAKCHLGLPRRCRGSNSEKQWNWPYLLKLFEYFDKIMHKHCYWRELDRGIAKCHLSSVEAKPRSKP